MYVPKKLKLNRFRVVQIPSAKDIFVRFGVCAGSNFSGDQVAPGVMSKLDTASVLDQLNNSKIKDEQEIKTQFPAHP